MGLFFVDESIHEDDGFIITACVYISQDPSKIISDILESAGFDSNRDEFKSGINFIKYPAMKVVRNNLFKVINSLQFGIIISPSSSRDKIGEESLRAIATFISANNILSPVQAYFDQGLFPSVSKAETAKNQLGLSYIECFFEQNSIVIRGVQLADLVAHTCSMLFKHKLGHPDKIVSYAHSSDPANNTIELSFELFAKIRYSFFHSNTCIELDYTDPIKLSTVAVEPFGLYLSSDCSGDLLEASRRAFGTLYLGCIE
jgi:hypothetical protein